MNTKLVLLYTRLAILSIVTSLICSIAGLAEAVPTLEVSNYQRTMIYHSPQTPGYTCWTGATVQPDDGAILVSFVEATGPVEGRPRAPEEVQEQLSWPPHGIAAYDMTGLDMKNVYLRSNNGGATWVQASADSFSTLMNGTAASQSGVALPGNTFLRSVWGHYLPYDDLPRTALLQRSQNGTQTWGSPELIMDPLQYTVWAKRLRVLDDDRVIMLGGLSHAPAGSLKRVEYQAPGVSEPLLLVSDDQGQTWSDPIQVVPEELRDDWSGEEFDVAELPNGDFLCVFRRKLTDGPEVRWQGRLEKSGQTWIPKDFGPAPFPHTGQPELLATREGPVLHIAPSGVHWTCDGGVTWQLLEGVLGTHYYPHSTQGPDGAVYIFGHVGGDDGYGAMDQSIVMDRFELDFSGAPEPSTWTLLGTGGLVWAAWRFSHKQDCRLFHVGESQHEGSTLHRIFGK